MPLPKLLPTGEDVDIQHTTFSIDALGRYICNSLYEATVSNGAFFDIVIIGSGMYGAYCATKIRRLNPNKRILVLEAGSFLVSEHVQNLARIGLNIPSPITPSNDSGSARDLVWGMPWRGNVDFPGLAYCVGGKSIYWGGWCPRLTQSDLAQWPPSTASYLVNQYARTEAEIGVTPSTDFISGTLFTVLKQLFVNAAVGIANIDTSLGDNGIEDAPLAVQGESPSPGLFSFDKYSSATWLADAVRDDVNSSGGNDANRHLFLVPKAHVIKLHTNANKVNNIELAEGGQRHYLPLANNTSVIIACSTIETTRLALVSFPSSLMGRNLMAHVRSDFVFRIRRSALPALPTDVETAAFLVRGVTASSTRFHLQVTASAHPFNSDELLFRMIPDLDFQEAQRANDDPNWITITIRGVGEMLGNRQQAVPNSNVSWINLSPYEFDEYGVPRAYVHFKLGATDKLTWQTMDQTCVALSQAVAGNADNIQFHYDNAWQSIPYPLNRPFPSWRRGLGTTYHEAGTLWMGDDPNTSVTNPLGKFHHIDNAYACDQSIFPTVSSANPTPTGLTLARQLATHVSSI